MPLNYESMGYKELYAKFDSGVLVITINRPKRFNSFAGEFVSEILDLFIKAEADNDVRVIVFTAEPTAPAYCSGADLLNGWGSLFKGKPSEHDITAHRDQGGMVTQAIYKCRKITIAAVNGPAAGVGLTAMQLPFDFRLAWAGAKLTFPFVKRGIAAEAASTYLLPRLIGHSKASALLLTGKTVKPDDPLIRDLYYAIYPTREEVFPAALALAKELAASTSVPAVTYTKSLLQHPGHSIEENHLLDSRIIRVLAEGKDAAEGAKAFMEKRAPKFTATNSDLHSFYPWWNSLDTRHWKSKL